MADENEARRNPGSDQARRRRSIALAVLLALLVVLFYVMAIMHGPSILSRRL